MRIWTNRACVFAAMLSVFAFCPPGVFAGADEPVAVDPDAGGEVSVLSERGLVTFGLDGGDRTSCENFGGADQAFSNPSRYRGVALLMEEVGRVDNFKVELTVVTTPVDLYFYIHRRAPGETQFTRVWPADGEEAILTVTDAGQAFYESGPVLLDVGNGPEPLQLDVDSQYAFGCAWSQPAVTYWRDDVPSNYYPRPFSKGSVLGGVAASTTPPIVTSLSLNPWSGGAYSVEVCFKPDPGACCLPGNVCDDTLDATGCLNAGGLFAGPQTTCGEISCPLEVAACCLPNETCDEFTQFVCESTEGGEWHQGMTCMDDPCSPRGACCVDDPITCVDDVTANQCDALPGGSYRGDDTRCEDFPGCNAGACCFGEQCVIPLSEVDCGLFGGVYQGDASLCTPDLCFPTGACCVGDTCVPDVDEAECLALTGTYRGDGSDCETLEVPCGEGACCSDFGCTDVPETLCLTGLQGTWLGDGTSCDSITPHCEGTCCWAGGCNGAGGVDLTPEDCGELPGGVFMGYTVECSDEPDPCALVVDGACCLPGGECVITTNDACIQLLGTDFAAGLTCAEVDCIECEQDIDCLDGDPCTTDACDGGICVHTPVVCDDSDPCTVDVCVDGGCVYFDVVCDDNDPCTDDVCVAGDCEYTPVDCSDGMFCNGLETCDPLSGDCLDNEDPCFTLALCDEALDICLDCTLDGQCDDGLFCNGVETCDVGSGDCLPGQPPCAIDQICDEENDVCVNCTLDEECDDNDLCTMDECIDGGCVNTLVVFCDDGAFCNGLETCDPLTADCLDGVPPCDPGQTCDEENDVCINPCPWDINGSGAVDPLDTGIIKTKFNCPVGTGDATCDACDLNGSGAVDPLDVGVAKANFGPCP